MLDFVPSHHTRCLRPTCCSCLQVKAFDGRWLCVDKAVYEPCGDGFTNSSSVCTQTCPPGWLDCKDRCSMPGLGCDVGAHPAFLCPLVGQQAAAAGAYRLAQETGSAQAEDAAAAPAQSGDHHADSMHCSLGGGMVAPVRRT
jgi:hypothetical protein